MKPVIAVENLTKRYRISQFAGRRGMRYATLRDTVVDCVTAPLRKLRGSGNDGKEDFWALRDVSFDVSAGEVIGIIGRNGAGKSTLLKILARITEPTSGQATLRGRVGSLLEVGTGFHPELSGRENIFLSGSILGMKRHEIRRKFDEIVEFSGVDKFLDTPVKRYSSGMHVRLAFSVAAHLEPEILLIDEVLAVGDVAFQKKCLGRMDQVARHGKTVFFVSHNMGLISDLCSRCIHLQQGQIIEDGEPQQLVRGYLHENSDTGRIDLHDWRTERSGDGPMRVSYLQTEGAAGEAQSIFGYREPITLRFGIANPVARECIVSISIRNASGHVILHPNNTDDRTELMLPAGEPELTATIADNLLNDGSYYVTVWLGDGMNVLHDRVGNCLKFDVCGTDEGKIRSRGVIRISADWRVNAPAAEPCRS